MAWFETLRLARFKPIQLARFAPLRVAWFHRYIDNESNEWQEHHFLVRDYAIGHLASGTSFLYLPQQDQVRQGTPGFYFIKKTDFANFHNLDYEGSNSLVDTINRYFRDAKFLHNKKANTKYLKRNEIGEYRIIHFSTHGVFNEETPELSYIVLTNSRLYAYQIAEFDFRNAFVVVSACESARGGVRPGGGVTGFVNALLLRGALGTVLGLWKLEASSGEQFFKEYYAKLPGKNFLLKLRQTKLKMLQTDRWSHPFFWGPYIYFGR